MKSRREFLKLVAAGSAAATLGRAGRVAAATTAKTGSTKHSSAASSAPARSAAIETEIGKQKKSTADALKTVRDRELPAGAALAFVFKPLRKNARGGRAS
ncbi:MAG: twin-arginine translocation signal domain-containing protein [Candidatus Eiseniibacteriota bacterium]